MPQTPAKERAIEAQAAETLLELLGRGEARFLESEPQVGGIDFAVAWQGLELAVEMKRSSEGGAIRDAIERLELYRRGHPNVVPVVATQFMGSVGKALCVERSMSWFDLSGNADIVAPGLRILIEGKPNQYKRPGRPSTVFAPKSSRITRWLLLNADTGGSQKQISEKTGLDKGYVSKVLKSLREQVLVRQKDDRFFPEDRNLLLRTWQAQYDFAKHHLIKGVVPARSGEEVARKVAASLPASEYAATGLAGAWFLDHFANFRLASFYLKDPPAKQLLERLSFNAVDKGANVWFVLPNDEGVFYGMQESDGVMCAHWLQVYLDLAAHPERSKEAAEHLRRTHQEWTAND